MQRSTKYFPTKTENELRYSRRVSSSCSTSGTRSAILVINSAISHERGTDREVLAIRVTYPRYIVTKIFRNGEASHRGNRKTFEVMLNQYVSLVQQLHRQKQPVVNEILTGTTSSGIWDQLRDKSYGWKCVSMDGMSCLLTINHVVKLSTYGWDVIVPNNKSRGYMGYRWMKSPVSKQ